MSFLTLITKPKEIPCMKPLIFFSIIAMLLFGLTASVKKTSHSVAFKRKLSADSSSYYIIVDKSDFELRVYDAEGWYATYPVVFGSKDQGDKLREGDKRTPNGKFKVILKKIHPKWSYEFLLDYPTPENVEQFKVRKEQGLIPKNAKIGSGIAIHATRPQEEWTIDKFYNWTDGCVSLKYTEMQDLYSYIPLGTTVTIQL
jgi:murein L,D-transpeptidase YafK